MNMITLFPDKYDSLHQTAEDNKRKRISTFKNKAKSLVSIIGATAVLFTAVPLMAFASTSYSDFDAGQSFGDRGLCKDAKGNPCKPTDQKKKEESKNTKPKIEIAGQKNDAKYIGIEHLDTVKLDCGDKLTFKPDIKTIGTERFTQFTRILVKNNNDRWAYLMDANENHVVVQGTLDPRDYHLANGNPFQVEFLRVEKTGTATIATRTYVMENCGTQTKTTTTKNPSPASPRKPSGIYIPRAPIAGEPSEKEAREKTAAEKAKEPKESIFNFLLSYGTNTFNVTTGSIDPAMKFQAVQADLIYSPNNRNLVHGNAKYLFSNNTYSGASSNGTSISSARLGYLHSFNGALGAGGEIVFNSVNQTNTDPTNPVQDPRTKPSGSNFKAIGKAGYVSPIGNNAVYFVGDFGINIENRSTKSNVPYSSSDNPTKSEMSMIIGGEAGIILGRSPESKFTFIAMGNFDTYKPLVSIVGDELESGKTFGIGMAGLYNFSRKAGAGIKFTYETSEFTYKSSGTDSQKGLGISATIGFRF